MKCGLFICYNNTVLKIARNWVLNVMSFTLVGIQIHKIRAELMDLEGLLEIVSKGFS